METKYIIDLSLVDPLEYVKTLRERKLQGNDERVEIFTAHVLTEDGKCDEELKKYPLMFSCYIDPLSYAVSSTICLTNEEMSPIYHEIMRRIEVPIIGLHRKTIDRLLHSDYWHTYSHGNQDAFDNVVVTQTLTEKQLKSLSSWIEIQECAEDVVT